MNAFALEGETALITGGGTGLGFAIAQCFVEMDARVVIVGRRREVLERAVERLGPNAFLIVQDITEFDESPELARRAREIAGAAISILVNNAGNLIKKPSTEMTVSEFQWILNTHLLAAHALTRAVVPDMVKRKHGHILFIASMASIIGLPHVLAYSAAKSACCGMTRSLASEFSPLGIRVNAIAPGWIETEMVKKALQNDRPRREKILSRTPVGHFGQPKDIGWAAVYLCSPAAKFVTGTVLCVDGGVSIGL